MKIMVVAAEWPKPDQASGHFRFFQLLSYLAPIHEILFCALDRSGSPHPRSEDDKRLTAIGIECGTQGFQRALRHFRPQIVWFEFFHQVRPDYVPFIRYLLPEARIIIDSVDVHFNRLEAKARLTQLPNDAREANEMRRKELAAYRQADIVVAVSQADAKILSDSLPQGIDVKVVPNVHPSQTFRSRTSRNFGELIFVGGFRHTPNVDGISFFINDILPLIRLKNPSVRVKVIGSNMPDAVRALAGEGIEIIGFVPETAPYLQSAYISIAPLRFGGG
jgi:hypothetical protein